MSEGRRFYLTTFIPAVSLVIWVTVIYGGYKIGIEIPKLCFFSFGFIWNWGLRFQSIIERTDQKQYKYSFLRFYRLYSEFFLFNVAKNSVALRRVFRIFLAPTVLLPLLLLFGAKQPFIIVMGGSLLFEGFFYVTRFVVDRKPESSEKP